jgi:hypothetical protein
VAASIRAEIEHLLVDRASWEERYKWRLQWDPQRVAAQGRVLLHPPLDSTASY